MLNNRERAALLFLAVSLVVGSVLALMDYRNPAMLEDFNVIRGAVQAPAPLTVADPVLHDEQWAGGKPSELVGLNSSSAEQLEQLPGVGPVMAERILEFRNANGPYKKIEDLLKVRGIGDRTLTKLRPLVKLD